MSPYRDSDAVVVHAQASFTRRFYGKVRRVVQKVKLRRAGPWIARHVRCIVCGHAHKRGAESIIWITWDRYHPPIPTCFNSDHGCREATQEWADRMKDAMAIKTHYAMIS